MGTITQENLSTNRVLLENFFQKLESTDEIDYGDCMREWNKDLLEFRERLVKPSRHVIAKLDEMQGYIQFNPNWDVASTRAHMRADIQKLRQLFTDKIVQ